MECVMDEGGPAEQPPSSNSEVAIEQQSALIRLALCTQRRSDSDGAESHSLRAWHIRERALQHIQSKRPAPTGTGRFY